MNCKYGRRFTAHLALYFDPQCLQIARRAFTSRFELLEFCCDFAILQFLGLWIDEDLVNAISSADCNARRNSYALTHATQFSTPCAL